MSSVDDVSVVLSVDMIVGSRPDDVFGKVLVTRMFSSLHLIMIASHKVL